MDEKLEERVKLSGNPFVDTGLAVIASLAGLRDIDNLTMEHVRHVHGRGDLLAVRNAKLKRAHPINACLVDK